MSTLANKVALVTGGSRGIGAASAVVKAIERDGGKAVAIQADSADTEAVKGAVEKTVATFGRLDVLVNNAGTAIPKTFAETTSEDMNRMIDINLRGTLAATQGALKHMQSGGRIIMIGSSVGERVLAPGLVAYSATKGAVKMFTQGLSREIGSRGITRRAIGRCLRRPPQRSTATDLLTKSPRWSRLWLVRRRRISPART